MLAGREGHGSYYDAGNGCLGKYKPLIQRETWECRPKEKSEVCRWDGRSWKIWTVDSGGDVGSFTSIALDSTGVPHIGYYDQLKHEVKIAKLVVSRESKIGGWMIIALVLFLVLLAMVHLRRK